MGSTASGPRRRWGPKRSRRYPCPPSRDEGGLELEALRRDVADELEAAIVEMETAALLDNADPVGARWLRALFRLDHAVGRARFEVIVALEESGQLDLDDLDWNGDPWTAELQASSSDVPDVEDLLDLLQAEDVLHRDHMARGMRAMRRIAAERR